MLYVHDWPHGQTPKAAVGLIPDVAESYCVSARKRHGTRGARMGSIDKLPGFRKLESLARVSRSDPDLCS